MAILTGSSEKVICAGMDLKQAATSRLLKTPPRDFFPVLGDNVHASTPIIAAVNGVALRRWLAFRADVWHLRRQRQRFVRHHRGQGRPRHGLADPTDPYAAKRIVIESSSAHL